MKLLARFRPDRSTPVLDAIGARLEAERESNELQRYLNRTVALYESNEKQLKERIDRLVRLFAWEIRAHDETKRVLVERQDQAGRVQYLERELKDMEQSRLDLANLADARWNELLALKAKKRKR